MFDTRDTNLSLTYLNAWISDPIPLLPERKLPDGPWDDEPGIDEPLLPEDPGEVPDDD